MIILIFSSFLAVGIAIVLCLYFLGSARFRDTLLIMPGLRALFKSRKIEKHCTSDGFVIESLTGVWAKKIKKNYFLLNDAIKINPGNLILPYGYNKWHSKYQNFDVRPSDVWVVSFPKSGTTWTQEMVWCILHNLDFEKAKEYLTKRFPYFEYEGLLPPHLLWMMPKLKSGDPNYPGENWKIIHELPNPRTLKSHLFKGLLPYRVWAEKPKIIYICRDPRDVCVSFYYHAIRYNGFKGEFDDFVELFLADKLIMFTPYWKHVLDYWAIRNEKHVLFIRYEDLKKDLSGMIQKVSSFLEKDLTKDQVEGLANHLSFENMKNNDAVNNENIMIFSAIRAKKVENKFMRKGKVGDWRNHLSKDQYLGFKEWTERNLANTDFPHYRNYDDLLM